MGVVGFGSPWCTVHTVRVEHPSQNRPRSIQLSIAHEAYAMSIAYGALPIATSGVLACGAGFAPPPAPHSRESLLDALKRSKE